VRSGSAFVKNSCASLSAAARSNVCRDSTAIIYTGGNDFLFPGFPVPAKDICHNTVKSALQKEGWTITHDPFPLKIGKKRLSADLGAERLISAEKGTQKIVVEVKSFVGQSDVKDLEQALVQYVLYRQILDETEIVRSLYLAVSRATFNSVFTIELGQILLKDQIIKLVVFDDEREAILQWILD
jgi:XisH protein